MKKSILEWIEKLNITEVEDLDVDLLAKNPVGIKKFSISNARYAIKFVRAKGDNYNEIGNRLNSTHIISCPRRLDCLRKKDAEKALPNLMNTSILGEIVNILAIVYGWNGFYNPEVKKVMEVDSDNLKTYLGKYQVNNNSTLFLRAKIKIMV